MLSHIRVHIGLIGSFLVLSAVACGRQQPPKSRPQSPNEVSRLGDDLFASGSAPQVADSVTGDAFLAGRYLQFSGATGGDYLGAGGTQQIDGRIHGAIRAAGGEVGVRAAVDRNVTIAGGTVVLDREAVIARNAYLAGGNVRVYGTVHGELLVSGGDVTLNGHVDRDVEITARKLQIGPGTIITGNLRYRVPPEAVHIDPAARVSGIVTALPVAQGKGTWHVFGLFWMLGFLLAGTVLVTFVPGFITEAANFVQRRPERSTLLGLGWIILFPLAVLIVALTFIGLPLAFLGIASYLTLLYLGRIAVAVWLGRRVLGARARSSHGGIVMNFAVGGLILVLVQLIPILGPLTTLVATVVGIGALLLQMHAIRVARPA